METSYKKIDIELSNKILKVLEAVAQGSLCQKEDGDVPWYECKFCYANNFLGEPKHDDDCAVTLSREILKVLKEGMFEKMFSLRIK